jgi:hypothetical protein
MMLFKGSLVLTLLLLRVDQSSVSQTEDDYVLRWASSGGLETTWQHCGYTGAFAATGLITAKDSDSAISTNSAPGSMHKKSPSGGRTYRNP